MSLREEEESKRTYEYAVHTLDEQFRLKAIPDGASWTDAFEEMRFWMKVFEVDEAVKNLSVIHVAGTKGKGSCCALTEGILRACGCRTGFFSSPHLLDIRERFRLDGYLTPSGLKVKCKRIAGISRFRGRVVVSETLRETTTAFARR
ncbi:hypothetical protein CYMTET_33913 [Cymbomonas tetramitiformis]|uniref:Uncharacterized protein n=1 Tax=Cymbomonas tetramitiformis TaxID=36881 RepID=A0AAE0KQH1_9CHLO|nr:hypothetical protein CYMTET_33913 [Cymbomonas tetramitiformis]